MSDDFWHQSKRLRSEIAAEAMSRLNFLPTTEPPRAAAMPETTEEERRAFYERQDRMFANGYVVVEGAPYPISRVLAQQLLDLGYDLKLKAPAPHYETGVEDEVRGD